MLPWKKFEILHAVIAILVRLTIYLQLQTGTISNKQSANDQYTAVCIGARRGGGTRCHAPPLIL